jgi:hypothetical protein
MKLETFKFIRTCIDRPYNDDYEQSELRVSCGGGAWFDQEPTLKLDEFWHEVHYERNPPYFYMRHVGTRVFRKVS